ncbi:MAG: hypothetical protein JNK74_26225 [Candidatus Hydrogenedentes bacterium]|nr:hypothetical protein [Candidatus Hydrogenedentota bacterium]
MRKHLSRSVLTGMILVALTGCPPEGGFPVPPFDTSGAYSGSWSGTSSDDAQTVAECPLELTLTQNLSLAFPGDHGVQGVATIDYTCIELPEWAQGETQPSTVEVGGVLESNGRLTLVSAACGTGYCVVLSLAGQGEDADSDGLMYTYAGDWSYQILLAGFEPFGFEGTFVVDAAAPEA